MKTLLIGGMVVGPLETITADILLEDGKVAALGRGLPRDGAEAIDVSGNYVLPGMIDAHTHITLDARAAKGSDVYCAGTLPAIMGGTTTIIDHLSFGPPAKPLRRQWEKHVALASGQAVTDYAFHGVIQELTENTPKELAALAREGICSLKAYMAYDFRLSDADLLKLLRLTGELGLPLTVHAEDHDPIARLRAEFKAQGKGAPMWHAKSRPAVCESTAVARVLRLARQAGDAPIYVVHLSTAAGLEEIKKARGEGQKNVFAETCTQYLALTEDRYADPVEGLKYIMAPPLRTAADCEALWRGLADGDIQTVATDHCSFSFVHDKQRGLDDFTSCPGGAPGLEERLSVLYSEGVAKGRITINTLADRLSTTPAAIFGLNPVKGRLLPGADADVVILNPGVERTLLQEDLHGPADYSLYDGLKLKGRIEAVFLCGNLTAKDNAFLGRRGQGSLLRRGSSMYRD